MYQFPLDSVLFPRQSLTTSPVIAPHSRNTTETRRPDDQPAKPQRGGPRSAHRQPTAGPLDAAGELRRPSARPKPLPAVKTQTTKSANVGPTKERPDDQPAPQRHAIAGELATIGARPRDQPRKRRGAKKTPPAEHVDEGRREERDRTERDYTSPTASALASSRNARKNRNSWAGASIDRQ